MIERLDKALQRAREEYKMAYRYEFDNKDDADLTDEQFEYARQLRNHIIELYWIKNEAEVKFEKSTIKVKFQNGNKKEY